MNVLIVDDEPDILASLEAVFQTMNCNPTLAKDGIEAQQLLQKNTYDIVVCDFLMPNLDGFELLSWLRKLNKDTFFVIISGYTNQSFSKQFDQLKVDSILQKPFSKNQIGEVVKKAKAKKLSNITSPDAKQSIQAAAPTNLSSKAVIAKLKEKLQGIVFLAIMDSSNLYILDHSLTSNVLSKVFYNTVKVIIDKHKEILRSKPSNSSINFTITTTSQIHYLTPLGNQNRLLYVVVSKEKSNLSIIRLILERYINELEHIQLEKH